MFGRSYLTEMTVILKQRKEVDTSLRASFQHHSKPQHGSTFMFSEGINDIHKQQMALLSLGLFLLLLIEMRFSLIPHYI